MERVKFEAHPIPKEGEGLTGKLRVLDEYVKPLKEGNYVPSATLERLRKEAEEWGPEDWEIFEGIRSGKVDLHKNEFVEKIRKEKGSSALCSLVESLLNVEFTSGGY